MIRIPTKFIKVKSEVRFQANDPWNGHRPGAFTVDTYATTFMKVKSVSADTKEPTWAGGFNRALRSDTDGVTRFLPESLVELWQTQQIPTSALPGLLHRIGPSLRDSDYRPILHDRKMKVGLVVEIIICACLVVFSVVGAVLFEAPWWTAVAVVLATSGVCWLFLYLLFFRRLWRRKRQMRWLLEQVAAGEAA